MTTTIGRPDSSAQAPLRAEILTPERLELSARLLARTQRCSFEPADQDSPLGKLLADAAAELAGCNSRLSLAVRNKEPISPAAEWLLDNYYLVDEQIRLVRDDLPVGYGRELPWLNAGDAVGVPRVYDAMLTLLTHSDSRVDEEYLRRFVEGFQDSSPLTIGEVWAVPIMLRIGLVENIRRLALRVVAVHEAARAADEWADTLLLTAQNHPDQLGEQIERLGAEADRYPVSFFVRLSQRLQGQDHGADAINIWLERRLVSQEIRLDDAAQNEQQTQAADQVSIANSITSIRFLDAYEWRTFFESVSLVEQVLREDPAGVYLGMEFKSRDRYRHAIESMARRCPHAEVEVAEAAVSLALEGVTSDPGDMVAHHVGYYLISAGRYALEESVDYRPHQRERLYRGPLRYRGAMYWGLLVAGTGIAMTILIASALALGTPSWAALIIGLISVVPASELALNIVNRVAASLFPPRVMPKLDHRLAVSSANRTLVVVPALMPSVSSVASVVDQLEVTYLANKDKNVAFGLLGDLKGSDTQHGPQDEDIIDAAVNGISRLNERYLAEHGREPFHLLIRGRSFSEAEQSWMGWERKRGALVELGRLLRGSSETSFTHRVGAEEFLASTAFVITLDADTVLPRDGARRLISTIAHPLNRARWSPGEERVLRGYGLVQPRVAMSLPGSSRSTFAQLYSGMTGMDPYAGAISDTYQDVFGEGSFTGKGIFEVAVFNGIMDGQFPENALLSHDLLEGNYLRTALASDVEVLDEHPSNYLSHAARLHRWVRGDWQTLPWLFARVPTGDGRSANPLTFLHRWKIIDNLRRSMVPISTVALITIGWALIPETGWAWPVLMALLVLFPAYFALFDSLIHSSRVSLGGKFAVSFSDFGRNLQRAGLDFVLMPHLAWLLTDAAIRAGWRMNVSRKNMLEWTTAAEADRLAGSSLGSFVRAMWRPSIVAAALAAVTLIASTDRALVVVPLIVAWLAAPYVAWRVSVVHEEEPSKLAARDRMALRRLARRTWRYFETFVGPRTHWLVPDNFQEDPLGVVAPRTSPTNIGLQLLATLTAYDLGYLTARDLTRRVADTLAAMAGLERFRGHFYNWYDIETLQPLPPNYVSTVDSGNLAGHLLVLRIGLLEMTESPLLRPALLDGVTDTVAITIEDAFTEKEDLGDDEASRALRICLDDIARAASTGGFPQDLGEWGVVLARLSELADAALLAAEGLRVQEPGGNADSPHPTTASERILDAVSALVRQVESARDLLDDIAPWAPLLREAPAHVMQDDRASALEPLTAYVPSIVGLAEGLSEALTALDSIAADPPGETDDDREAAVTWAANLGDGIRFARPAAVELLARARLDANIAREMWEHTDFRILFDAQRLLFSIGYNTAEGRLDGSYYDMLASECRLASFLAIAKGDVPQEHWFRLGRALTQTSGGRALLSWSASMFEYLMPALVMRSWPDTLLDETYTSVVRRQMQYGNERSVPWGVSESAFNAKDAQLVYQYQAFGVPGLGLKRGLSEDVVVAPYAAVLCLPIVPDQVLRNLDRFAKEGGSGRYGYYEAIDFTPGRIPAGQRRAVVASYFAHHQGMSLVAMGNALTDERMLDRFHSDPLVSSAELLLQERVPRDVALAQPNVEEVQAVTSLRELPPPVTRSYPTAKTPVPSTHFLSNGSYSVMVTNAGGGYSRWKDMAISRYREDVTRDTWGTFFYLRDVDTGDVWSATNNPVHNAPDDYHVTFSADKAEFRRVDGDIETRTEVAVSPEDDVEIRRLTVVNHGREPRRLEVTSYFEISFADQRADQAHKSFSNLFIETELADSADALLFSRRPRSSEEERVWGFHALGCDASTTCACSYETSRAAFLGRLRQADHPAAVHAGGELGNAVGAVLDPSCSIRRGVEIPAGGSVHFAYTTGASESRAQAVLLAEKYHDPRSAQRAIDMAWTAAQIELKDLGITPAEAVVLQRLASRLLLTDPVSRLKVHTPVENELPLSGLWSLGISGDHPILLVRIEELEHAPLVRQALLAHQYWRHKGLVSDLVILNTRPTAYSDELDDRLRLLVRTGHALQLVDKPGGIFLRRADQMHPDVLNLLLSVARATLEGDGGSIGLQLDQRGHRERTPDDLVVTREPDSWPAPAYTRPPLMFDNGYGGFDTHTGEYVIVLRDGDTTPAPWVNVMASPEFGCMVTEAGIGCTWAKNSHENRITTWNNDPVSDGSGEVTYVRDDETGEFWSPTPLPVPDDGTYEVRHGKGTTRFLHESHGVAHTVEWFVAKDDPVRLVRLTLTNTGARTRRLSATHFVEWVLGSSRSAAQQAVVTWFDAENEILTAHNHYNMDFPGRRAFLACDRPLHSYTASRTEFVGRNRRPSDPAAMHRKGLGAVTGRYTDNCGALMVGFELAPGQTESVTFMLGQTDALDEGRDLVARYRAPSAIDDELASVRSSWADLLATVEVSSPDPALDLMVNGQLLYQALACRLWGRTATYQSSGAYGFRDQLQDSVCLLYSRPELVREQIIEASRHQFAEGDVLHWWQPFSGRGVRTRISDDRHWLPYVTAEYVRATGDTSVLDEQVAFIEGPPVDEDREDNYLQPTISEHTVSVFDHCVAALEAGRPVGEHGLPLMGGGDWNDGMNRVGLGGQGESVWLGWFLDVVLRRFADIAENRGEEALAEDMRKRAAHLIGAIESHGWDGSWYRRAYFDDGTPLGSSSSDECRIDAIAQSWATISGQGSRERAITALDSLEDQLVSREAGLIRLLTPPFDEMDHDPGYIKGYVPGVRENGGQYTHAALWAIVAFLLQGDGDEAHGLVGLVNPINHAHSREEAQRYRVEPYVVAADVYAVEPHVGRGGWTWYTGSAGWFYRMAIEFLFGLKLVAQDGQRYFTVDPCIPKSWEGFRLTYRFGEAEYRISVANPRGINRGVAHIEVDGKKIDGDLLVPLIDDGETHDVLVTMLGG